MGTTKKTLKTMTSEDRIALRDKTAKELNEKLAAMGKQTFTDDRVKRVVGGGTQVGDTFTLTGEVCIAEIAGSNNVFLAVLTETGEKLSIKSLIPQSVAGYTDKSGVNELAPLTEGENEADHKADENYQEIEATFDEEVAGGAASEIVKSNKKLLDHGTRSDIELYGLISEKIWNCKGLKLTYCGKVVHQTKASKDYEFGESTVKKGARRAMTISVWKVSK